MRNNNNPSRAKQRRAGAEGALPSNRPGAEDHKSLGKSLSPQAQKHLQEAKSLGKAGDHVGSAKIYRQLAEQLAGDGKAELSTRAFLRAARSLHKGGNEAGRDKALDLAIAQAKLSPNKKKVLTHFRDLVRRLRQGGNNEVADSIQSKIMAGMDRKALGRTTAEGRDRRGGGRRRQG